MMLRSPQALALAQSRTVELSSNLDRQFGVLNETRARSRTSSLEKDAQIADLQRRLSQQSAQPRRAKGETALMATLDDENLEVKRGKVVLGKGAGSIGVEGEEQGVQREDAFVAIAARNGQAAASGASSSEAGVRGRVARLSTTAEATLLSAE
eukprot:2608034-Pleurochrysis_carterae.AAC.4